MQQVYSEGRRSARLVLIGEAWGKDEEKWQRPFVGRSGQLLEFWWRDVGLSRDDFYIDNVLHFMPRHPLATQEHPAINFIPRSDIEAAFDALHERLAQLDDPWLIVPTGNYALYGVTGLGKVSWHSKDGKLTRPGITSWRGSILEYTDARGRRIKVIPTIHPAATFRTASYERECRMDWARISSDARYRELRLPQRRHVTATTLGECASYLARAERDARELSIDVETPIRVEWGETSKPTKTCECGHASKRHAAGELRQPPRFVCGVRKCGCIDFTARHSKPRKVKISEERYLSCIGFAYTEDESLTIPIGAVGQFWRTAEELEQAYDYARRLCALPIPKVGQNFASFDAFWLQREGFPVVDFRWDTRWMSHVLNPTGDHDLAYLASIHTREPFWKGPLDYAKDETLVNGRDVCVTLEIKQRLLEELTRRGRLSVYDRLYARRFAPASRLSAHGVRVDENRRRAKLAEFEHQLADLRSTLESRVGMPLHTDKGLSQQRVKYYLYGPTALVGREEKSAKKLTEKFPGCTPLKLPKQYKKSAKGKETKTITTDEVTIRRLKLRYPGRLDQIADLILDARRLAVLKTFVRDEIVSADGRIRCQYVLSKDTGRMASTETPIGEGRNLQNWDRELRDVVVPD